MVGREDEIQRLRSRLTEDINVRNEVIARVRNADDNNDDDKRNLQLAAAKEELKEARKELNRTVSVRNWEREWWQ
jgi:hypothetical protein